MVIDIIFGVNLWRGKDPWPRYTVWWAVVGLIFSGGNALVNGDIVGLITQATFSGSLILLLTGTPTRGRTITAVLIYVVGYIGFIMLFLAISFLSGLFGAL